MIVARPARRTRCEQTCCSRAGCHAVRGCVFPFTCLGMHSPVPTGRIENGDSTEKLERQRHESAAEVPCHRGPLPKQCWPARPIAVVGGERGWPCLREAQQLLDAAPGGELDDRWALSQSRRRNSVLTCWTGSGKLQDVSASICPAARAALKISPNLRSNVCSPGPSPPNYWAVGSHTARQNAVRFHQVGRALHRQLASHLVAPGTRCQPVIRATHAVRRPCSRPCRLQG